MYTNIIQIIFELLIFYANHRESKSTIKRQLIIVLNVFNNIYNLVRIPIIFLPWSIVV